MSRLRVILANTLVATIWTPKHPMSSSPALSPTGAPGEFEARPCPAAERAPA
jgi:hypothetical protein